MVQLAEKAPGALKTIGEVADQLDVATHVLRFWESKFNQIKPQKRRGRRYYSPEDVQVLSEIKALLYGQGYTIKGVKKYFSSKRKSSEFSSNLASQHGHVVANANTQLGSDAKERLKLLADNIKKIRQQLEQAA